MKEPSPPYLRKDWCTRLSEAIQHFQQTPPRSHARSTAANNIYYLTREKAQSLRRPRHKA